MYIGELAKKSGASRKAIYLYEQLGLIQKPVRKSNYRVYPALVVDQIQTIRCAQSVGFKLKELVETLANNTNGLGSSVTYMIEQIRLKRLAIELQIESAQAQIKLLNQFEQQLRDSPDTMQCGMPVDSSPRGKL